MGIGTQITRIKDARDRIRTKVSEFGLVSEDAKIDECASAIENIENLGSLNMVVDNETTGVYEIPQGYTSGGSISVTVVKQYYYNDILLPKLPSEYLDTYPYCWIRDNNSTGYYDLIMGNTSFYYDSGNSRLKHRGSDSDIWYRISKSESSTATSWGSNVSHSYVGWTVDNNRTAIWANHDVTQSSSSTEIYLAGSDPEPEISGQELLAMLEETL